MKIFGQHDGQTIIQFQDVRSRAVDAALMADGHVGYVMPIGGVAAYRDQVSVVGVGFDIACLAIGTPVVTSDGYHLPIDQVTDRTPVACWYGAHVREVSPNFGNVGRGVRATLAVRLANGRTVRATADHRFRTRDGWRAAGELLPGDVLACVPFMGLPRETTTGILEVPLTAPAHVARLEASGLWPVDVGSAVFPALLRVLGYVNGDGHLPRDGSRVSVYTTDAADAADISRDFAVLGFVARQYRRSRGDGRRDEINVSVYSTALSALLAALGAPVGRKAWPAEPMPWLLELPGWMRAHYLSAFASAEMMTPRVHANGVVPNLQLKQAGDDRHSLEFVARILASLDFATSIAWSGPPHAGRRTAVLQVLGGQAEQLRYVEQVGFCRAREKRVAAAAIASVAWSRATHVAAREAAKTAARTLHGAGIPWREVVARVASEYEVPQGFVYHAIYDRRGTVRRLPGACTKTDHSGEAAWVTVVAIEEDRELPVFDVVTGDPAASFLAAGVVVHNCGNAAIRTDLTLDALGDTPEEMAANLSDAADAIAATVSFGIGRRNRADDAPVDDPLFEDPAWDAVPAKHRRALRSKAREQLGTVGSGNHYVDVFADETGAIWVGVHFGSRGFGHTVASAFLALGQGKPWGERAPEREVLLDVAQPIGHDYWHLMNLAGRYAYAGREWVARKVVEMLGARELELVHNHHNFAWKETHGGEELIVVRKGATPAFPGQKGFIGGSMGDDAVIVRGTTPDAATPETLVAQREALYSTVHGAGRVMSRTLAAGKRNRRTGRIIAPGRVTPEMMQAWVREKGVILRGGGLDESPHVYRRLPEVLAAQEGTVEVLHTLRPLIVVMAGADEFDPYKD